ncbi:MAG: tetratricopeptide repeat protein [Syntrophobacteraceae bacterium]
MSYSKSEALHILGQKNGGEASQFRYLLEGRHPDIKLNWSKILEGIKTNMHVLPDLYNYKETRLRADFRRDLCTFARQIMRADPQGFISAAGLIREHATELEYLADLIRWRLDLCKQERNEWNVDNPFYWRFALQGTEVPPDIEEQAAGFYERGEYDQAAVLFRFLTDCFSDYAEGYNYLGLISLKTGKLEEAIGYFRQTMDLGRKLFPKRIARSHYWSDFSTRPYMRGMMNLALALNRAGYYKEALEYLRSS